jgi:hypothetical protein
VCLLLDNSRTLRARLVQSDRVSGGCGGSDLLGRTFDAWSLATPPVLHGAGHFGVDPGRCWAFPLLGCALCF